MIRHCDSLCGVTLPGFPHILYSIKSSQLFHSSSVIAYPGIANRNMKVGVLFFHVEIYLYDDISASGMN